MQRFRGGLVFEARRLLYHLTLGLRVMKKKRRSHTCHPRIHPPPLSIRPNQAWNLSHCSAGRGEFASDSQGIGHQKWSIWSTREGRRFRGGLVFEAHRLLYHSTLSLRAIKKKSRWMCMGASRVQANLIRTSIPEQHYFL